ncbi:orotate phosphoribosyltransferase [Ornithinibacillus bavariensis]|uniref:Orotate phosphoribosyltransferase n=1 Tax=Ornithinibacillus bavariensis TaxID=545502 RepID=A0A919X554_9BACI|nr:orotate phosphoribosyltransferase [Ornithinibacillus bavariensis]GIO26091.1 orotate phosphoribosyltransferase [Ornithinibacillus bavariensis]HAM82184.1 orotate phosphoribosyltransferase [Ornithinibacillus sp.]
MKLSQAVVSDLLRIKAVQIETNPNDYFTWASGIKSPIYCDNRITMSYPEVRQKITKAFVEKVQQMKTMPDVIAGCATAGIPHAAWLADQLNLPMVYVRSKPKEHGRGNQIEGENVQGKKVLVIEDLISTGGSSLAVVDALKHAGAEILEVMAIFTYGLTKATANFEQAGVNYQTITSYEDLIQTLVVNEAIGNEEKAQLLEWRSSMESR